MGDDDKIIGKIDAIAGLVKDVPVYQDGLQPAVRQIGKDLETLSKTIHIALTPISVLVWGYEKIEVFIKQKLNEKLKDVPPGRIKTPPAIIAGPIIESLRFAGQEEDIKELYANLLATSMDSETVLYAHPGFVQIIKNMSPDEAKIMKFMSNKVSQPLIDIKAKIESSYLMIYRNFSLIGKKSSCVCLDLTPNYLDNLSRLGLIEIVGGEYIVDVSEDPKNPIENKEYMKLKLEKEFVEIEKNIENIKDHKIDIDKKFLRLTDFGEQFCSACVIDKNLQGKDL